MEGGVGWVQRHSREKSILRPLIWYITVSAMTGLNPFTPKSDQVQISPVASPVILHHTVWRTWLFIAYSDWKMIPVPVLTTSLIHFSWKGWENVLFELGIERVNTVTMWWQMLALIATKTSLAVAKLGLDFACWTSFPRRRYNWIVFPISQLCCFKRAELELCHDW